MTRPNDRGVTSLRFRRDPITHQLFAAQDNPPPVQHSQPHKLPAEVLAEIFQFLPSLQSLQTGGYSWEVLLYALDKAKFQQSLKSLSLFEIHLLQSDVPLYTLMTSALVPRLEELRITESAHPYKSDTAGPIWQSMALPHLHGSDSAKISRSTTSRVAGSASGQQQYLKSLTLARFGSIVQEKHTSNLANLSKDFSILPQTLRHMTLDLPADYCQTAARNLRQTLPHLTTLGLSLEGERFLYIF